MPSYLTTASTILCPHGGQAILLTANRSALAGAPILLESDMHPVVGCPFTVGLKYSPCIRIEWTAAASRTSVQGTATLVQSSIGQCLNVEGAIQGIAIIATTQPQVSSQ